MLKALFITSALLFASSAWANSAKDARELITLGDYKTARAIAETLETAEGYALAAESLSAQILLGEISKLNKKSKEARKLSEKALELEPALYNAQLQYVLSDGFVTRTSGDLTAWRKKLPSKTLAKIQAFRAAYPDDPKGAALEGAWHLGVIRKTGEGNGGKWFGASLAEGERLYALARAATPQDVLIETNYALSLLVLDREAYAPKVRLLLEAVATMPASDDLYKKVQAKAAKILAASGDLKAMEKMAERFLDGQPLA